MSKEYYLQDSSAYNGNMIVWWRAGGGYTSVLSLAEKFTESRAFNQNQSRETDIPWPCDYIDSRTIKAVDIQNCKLTEALAEDVKFLNKKDKYKARKAVINWTCCGRFVRKNDYGRWYNGDCCSKCSK